MNDIKKICNATNLKYLAVALMFLDQIYQMFGSMGAPIWLTMLGRLAFPIFLFLAADSFHYTHDRMAYLRRLLYMSWFMIVGNAIIGSIFHNGSIGLTNNAFSTFFITGIFICSWDLLAKGLRDKSNKELIQGIGVFLLPILSSIPVVILAGIFETPHANPLLVQIVAFILSLVPSSIMVEGGFVMGFELGGVGGSADIGDGEGVGWVFEYLHDAAQRQASSVRVELDGAGEHRQPAQ